MSMATTIANLLDRIRSTEVVNEVAPDDAEKFEFSDGSFFFITHETIADTDEPAITVWFRSK